MSKPDNGNSAGRLMEIIGVLQKHNAIRGITPEKLRLIVEDLGPTFVKLGQMLSMRADLLPPAYCEELQKLRSDVSPMSAFMALAVTAAYFVKGLCGFANTLVFTTLMSFQMNNIALSPIDLLTGFPANLLLAWRERKSAKLRVWGPLSIVVMEIGRASCRERV